MFSNLSQNSILYILDLKGQNKILNGFVEKVSAIRPKYNNFNPNMEMVVDITATVNGEKREFKGVPNGSIADFGTDSFVLAENKEILNAYINSMRNNSKSIVESIDKHKKLIEDYDEALQELNPSIKAEKEKDKTLQTLQEQVMSLQESVSKMMEMMGNKTQNQ